MAADRPDTLDVRVTRFLRAEHPFAYCDECLAALLLVSPAAIRAVSLRLTSDPDRFQRISRMCYRCRRTTEITVLNA